MTEACIYTHVLTFLKQQANGRITVKVTHLSKKVTTMVAIPITVIWLISFRAHLRLNFDLKATAEPASLLQRGPCNATYCFKDPLSHLLCNNLIIKHLHLLTESIHCFHLH